jgi:hypothetical protein
VGPGNGHDGRKFGKGMEGFRVKKRRRGRARTQLGAVDRAAGYSGQHSEESAEGEADHRGKTFFFAIGRPIGGLEAAWSGS